MENGFSGIVPVTVFGVNAMAMSAMAVEFWPLGYP